MAKVRKKIEYNKIQRIAVVLKTIAHPIRLEVLQILETTEPLSVTQLLEKLDVEASLLSHHLTKMKDRNILESYREGRNIYYQIADREITKIFDCMEKCNF